MLNPPRDHARVSEGSRPSSCAQVKNNEQKQELVTANKLNLEWGRVGGELYKMLMAYKTNQHEKLNALNSKVIYLRSKADEVTSHEA